MSFVATKVPFFGPKQVPGLALWLDASDATTITMSGTNVTQWRDKSSNAHICISNANYGGTTLPTYNSNAIYKNVNFADNQVLVTSCNWNYVTSWSCFVALNTVNLGARWLISPFNGVSLVMMGMNQGINKIFNPNVGGLTGSPADITGNHIEYTSAENTNAISNILWYRDGLIQGSNFKSLSVPAGTPKMGIGANATFNNSMAGTYQLYEVLIYNRFLTISQRQQVEGHLAWKWGLQTNLPANHPYRFNSQQTLHPFTAIQKPFINVIKPYHSDFSPRSIPGCALWLDAADASTLTLSNNTVAQWADKSGNSNNATQPIGSNQPAYSNSFIFLNGVNQFFNVNLDFLAGVSHNSFIVLRNFNYTNIYGSANGDSGNRSLHVGFQFAGAYRMNYWGNDWYPAIRSNYRVNQINLLNFNWINDTSKIIYANGGLESNIAQRGIIGTMAGGGRIGNVANSTNAFSPAFINANIYEILMYTGTLTTAQRQQVEGYLASKWGILGSLAPSNPFRGNIRTLIYPNITISRPLVHSVARNNVRWAPTQIPGCALWLDAADATSVTVLNGNATQWRDKSGLSNNGTATGTIAYRSAAINTFNAMSYSGAVSTYFRGSNSNSTNVLTCFSVATMNSGTYASGRILSLGLAGTFDYNNTRYCAAIERGGAGINAFRASAPLGTSALPGFAVPFLCCSLFNGTNHTMFVNGIAGTTVASTGNFAYRVYNIGNSLGEENLVYWNGFIGEVIVYNSALSTRQRQQVEGYLAYKWGLRVSLPENHPYKNIPVS
jgi:hypothetical protein